MTEKAIYDNILNKCNNLEHKFIDFFDLICNKWNVNKTITDPITIDMIKSLIFGVDEEMPMKKLDVNKNRNLIKQLFLNNVNLKNSIYFIQDIVKQLEEFVNHVATYFETNMDKLKNKGISEVEYKKLKYLFYSYGWECTHIRSYCSDIQTLIDNSGCITNTSIIKEKPTEKDLKKCKKDTLKRYYFTDSYTIKNNIRYFDMKSMIFGETNTIMRMYNLITDFLFKDFMFMYNVIKTNISVLAQVTK